jgi:hypothetical protein
MPIGDQPYDTYQRSFIRARLYADPVRRIARPRAAPRESSATPGVLGGPWRGWRVHAQAGRHDDRTGGRWVLRVLPHCTEQSPTRGRVGKSEGRSRTLRRHATSARRSRPPSQLGGGAIHPFVGAGAGSYFLQGIDNGNNFGPSQTKFGARLLGGVGNLPREPSRSRAKRDMTPCRRRTATIRQGHSFVWSEELLLRFH